MIVNTPSVLQNSAAAQTSDISTLPKERTGQKIQHVPLHNVPSHARAPIMTRDMGADGNIPQSSLHLQVFTTPSLVPPGKTNQTF